jgi:hypothetical protein
MIKQLFTLCFLSLVFSGKSQQVEPVLPKANSIEEPEIIFQEGNTLEKAAEQWTPEQKKEFAEVFFIERGKFTVPKEPIVLKSFKGGK